MAKSQAQKSQNTKGFAFEVKRRMEAKGFTLIELLLVVVLIGILSGIILSVVNVSALRARSRDAQRTGDLKRIQTALELYFSDFRGYPASRNWLQITSTGSNVLTTALRGTYIQNIPQDPRNAEAMVAAQCGQSNFGYYYKTEDCGASPCLASAYVIATFAESVSTAQTSMCSSLANCTTGRVSGCTCAAPCYGVENPL